MTKPDKDFLAGLMGDYYDECEEHLAAVRSGLLGLEASTGGARVDKPLLDDLFRRFHTIKGLSGMVGFKEAEELAHQVESYLRALTRDEVSFSQPAFDALVASTGVLEQILAAHRMQAPIPDVTEASNGLLSILPDGQTAPGSMRPGTPGPSSPSTAGRSEKPAREGAKAWKVTFTPSPELAGRGVNVNEIRARLQAVGSLVGVTPQIAAEGEVSFEFIVEGPEDGRVFSEWGNDGITYGACKVSLESEHPSCEQPPTKVAGESLINDEAAPSQAFRSILSSTSVRVDLGRLNELMQIVSELVIGRSYLQNQIDRLDSSFTYQQIRPLQESSSALERKLRRLREGVMRLRMVPVRDLFERMKFAARDVARDHEKNVRTEISGEGTEIDRLLLEKVSDAILHLVRNAVAHGIEPKGDRIAAGKQPQGKVELRAFAEGDEVVLVVDDDGRGMDVRAMEKEAVKTGSIRPGQAFDQEALLELICRPGFTTATEADLAKGRGVGMAVVKKTVLELGGTLAMSTAPGTGTSFSLRLPLTLAIVDALIVSVGPQTFALPIASVREIMEVDPGSVTKLEKNELIAYRGGVLPLIRLSEAFGIPGEERRGLYVLVTGSQASPVGIGVDRLKGQAELVVRSLGDRLIAVPGFSGAAEIGDGRVALILDVPNFIRVSVDKRARFT